MILVSTDGSELSDKAIKIAANLAKQLGTRLLGVTVVKVKGSKTAADNLQKVLDAAEEAGVECTVEELQGNVVAESILEAANRYDVKFLVMASRGLSSLGSLLIGSSTQQVLARATRPVLVVR